MDPVVHLVGKKNINASKIILLKAEANYSEVFFTDGKKIIISKTLKELENRFSSFGFFRPHKSYLINLKHVVSFNYNEDRKILLTNNFKADLSRRKKELFIQINKTKKASI